MVAAATAAAAVSAAAATAAFVKSQILPPGLKEAFVSSCLLHIFLVLFLLQ